MIKYYSVSCVVFLLVPMFIENDSLEFQVYSVMSSIVSYSYSSFATTDFNYYYSATQEKATFNDKESLIYVVIGRIEGPRVVNFINAGGGEWGSVD